MALITNSKIVEMGIEDFGLGVRIGKEYWRLVIVTEIGLGIGTLEFKLKIGIGCHDS